MSWLHLTHVFMRHIGKIMNMDTPLANDMFTPRPAKHYKLIHWTRGVHDSQAVVFYFSLPHEPVESSQTLCTVFIDHCNIDFHWVRHRNITIK